MAEIVKTLEFGVYRFELSLKSKTVDAHSLMTDHNVFINAEIDSYAYQCLIHILLTKIKLHQENHK